MKMRAAVAALALAAAALSGCGRSSDSCAVSVHGEFGAPVTIDVSCAAVPGSTVIHTDIEGDGNPVAEDGTVLLRATSFDSRTGEIIESYDSGHLRLATLNSEELGSLAGSIDGVAEGSRIVVIRPGLVHGNRQSAEIVVVDLMFTIAHGTQASDPEVPPAGMPKVSIADGGGPSVEATGEAIPELAVVPLVNGMGSQVASGDTIAAQYSVYDTAGTLVDTTWNGGSPVALDLDLIMDGLGQGLVDQRVGSRVVVLVPSAQAQGTGDRIVVVDVLGILSSTTAGQTASP